MVIGNCGSRCRLRDRGRRAEGGAPRRFVLLDLTMPVLSGVQVLEPLHARGRSTGMCRQTEVLVNGGSDCEVTRNPGRLAIAGVLLPPFTRAGTHALLDRVTGA